MRCHSERARSAGSGVCCGTLSGNDDCGTVLNLGLLAAVMNVGIRQAGRTSSDRQDLIGRTRASFQLIMHYTIWF